VQYGAPLVVSVGLRNMLTWAQRSGSASGLP